MEICTQFLGFLNYGDEYKVMGLSAYGKPTYLSAMRDVIRLCDDGTFRLNLDYFVHHSKGVDMTWDGGEPHIGIVYSRKMIDTFGLPRSEGTPVEERHQEIAASLQARYEECLFHILKKLHE